MVYGLTAYGVMYVLCPYIYIPHKDFKKIFSKDLIVINFAFVARIATADVMMPATLVTAAVAST